MLNVKSPRSFTQARHKSWIKLFTWPRSLKSAKFAWHVPLALVIGGLLSGCASFNYTAEDAPVGLSGLTSPANRPRVAVVLGSGGPRGYAHVGVIKVLEEAGIKPDLIVGSSVGSLIGAFWATGMPASEVERISFSGGPLTLFDFSLFADRGWIRGQKLQNYVNAGLNNQKIEQLQRQLIVVATRRDDKRPVFFSAGNIGVAVRASSAVPGVFSPVGIDGVEYEDADESLPVAVQVARQAGADFVIAVDVSAVPGSAPPDVDMKWLQKDARRRSRIDPETAVADFLIHPDLGYWASPLSSYFAHARTIGELTARQSLPRLRSKLATFQTQNRGGD